MIFSNIVSDHEFVNKTELLSLFASYISIVRNIFLTTSLSFVCYSYGSSFKYLYYRKAIHIIAFIFVIFSILYGLLSNIGFNHLLNNLHVDKKDKDNILIFYQIKHQLYLVYVALIIMSCIALISLHRLHYLYF